MYIFPSTNVLTVRTNSRFVRTVRTFVDRKVRTAGGKVDFALSGVTITKERRESVNFSEPYYVGGTVMAVLKQSQAGAQGGPLGFGRRIYAHLWHDDVWPLEDGCRRG